MVSAAQQADKSQGIEYSIYTFDLTESKKDESKAEKHGTKTEMSDAIDIAEKLLKSGKCGKVEVKQKYFDKKKNREIDTILKTFKAKPKMEINAIMILVFAILCGGLAFGATYFLSR